MTLYPKIIVDALASVIYAGTKQNIVESDMLADQPVCRSIDDGEKWQVEVVLTFPRETDPFLKSTVKAAEAAIKYHVKQVGMDADLFELKHLGH